MPVPSPAAAPTIDVHTHFFPRELAATFDADAGRSLPSLVVHADGSGAIMLGGKTFRRVSAACWDAERRIERMDRDGITMQVLSPVPVTLIGEAAVGVAAAWSRRQNELLAEIAASRPDRFAALGMVPLQDPDAAVTELEYALTELGLQGVEIGTETAGRELDDPALSGFFAAAAALSAPIFVHPTGGGAVIRRDGQPYDFGLGMLTDTALAAAALVFGGVLERFPASGSRSPMAVAPSPGHTRDWSGARASVPSPPTVTASPSWSARCGWTRSCLSQHTWRWSPGGSVPSTSCSAATFPSTIAGGAHQPMSSLTQRETD